MEKKSPSQEDSHILSKYFITPKIINFFLFFYFYDKIGSCNIFCVSKKKKKRNEPENVKVLRKRLRIRKNYDKQ